jgi:C-terminal processing protease CtpA/Prc
MNYTEAFNALYKKASKEYPFTVEKKIDWDALYKIYSPRVADVKSDTNFYIAIRDFTWEIPDGHIGGPFNAGVFQEERGGGFGLVLTELSDGKVIATKVLPNYPAESAGIQIGAEIATWNGEPVEDAIANVVPYFGPFSTDHTRHLQQVAFLTRVAPGDKVKVTFKNPGDSTTEEVTLSPVQEYDSFYASQPSWSQDKLILPLDARILDSGLAYIRLVSFSDDTNLTAHQWDRYMKQLVYQEIHGLIIDLRINGGGSLGLALDMAGYFYDEEVTLYREAYYNEDIGKFEYQDTPAKIKPGPRLYEGNIAVLVSPDCVSACEGFAYALAQTSRAIVVGHYPTAGAFGEVGLGQYKLPGDQNFQIPTGRPETMDGKLVIEGTGVVPSIIVAVTESSALGKEDTVLEAAINALLKK